MKFSEVVEKLGEAAEINSLKINPEVNPELKGVAAVNDAIAGSFSYIENSKFAKYLSNTAASALIIKDDPDLQAQANSRGIAWITTPSPRLLFAQTIRLFYQPYQPTPEIDPTAIIDPSVKLGENIYIGPYVVIRKGVTIGDGVCIHPHVVIYPDSTIGDRTILHANCTIQERTKIGADCVIHSGAVIGAEGFGFVPSPQGWYKIEQSGYVVLEDGVEVGCNSAIDRPPVGITQIGLNTKVDNLVQIGHGCQVGNNCSMSAQVGLAGQVKIGNRVILAGQVGIANDVTIGDGAIASAQTGIHHDVQPGEVVSGSPAVPNKLYLKVSAIYKRLPEIYQAYRQKGIKN